MLIMEEKWVCCAGECSHPHVQSEVGSTVANDKRANRVRNDIVPQTITAR